MSGRAIDEVASAEEVAAIARGVVQLHQERGEARVLLKEAAKYHLKQADCRGGCKPQCFQCRVFEFLRRSDG